MKNLLYACLLSLFVVNIAQAQASFVVFPNPADASAAPAQYDTPADAHITNVSGGVINVKWERLIIENPGNLTTQVCDPNLCWLATVSSKTFQMMPGDTGQLLVHFLNPNQLETTCLVHIKLTNLDNPNEILTAVYTFSSLTTGVNDLPKANVKLFPNPATDFFTLENADAVSSMRLYSMEGRLLKTFEAVPGQSSYSLEGFAAGTYILSLQDKNGQSFQGMEVHKN